MKAFSTFKWLQVMAGVLSLAAILIFCFFCWQLVTSVFNQASEQVKHSFPAAESKLLSGN